MRYIKKGDAPDFFLKDTASLELWKDYYSKKKRKLKKYILEKEQNWLCCYCEAKLDKDFEKEESDKSLKLIHVEHIKPKHIDVASLTFNYSNLAVSCDGKCFTNSNHSESCGHKKDDEYNEKLFLDPTKVKNIRDYFKYSDNGKIEPSELDKEKSEYMIGLLKLETLDKRLAEERKKSLKEFQDIVKRQVIKTKQNKNRIIKFLLEKENIAFISFLRFKYQKVLYAT
jgi:uncharacterized protein (TIGR02646 family)